MTSTHTHTPQHPPQHHGHFTAARRHSTTSPYTIPPKNNMYIQQQQQQQQQQQHQQQQQQQHHQSQPQPQHPPHLQSMHHPYSQPQLAPHLSSSVPLLSRDFVVRRISEGESGRLKEELKCEACGKGYKHISSLAKHLWEHTPEWNVTKKLLISKHQQVQLLEAASILVGMTDKGLSSTATSRRNSIMPNTISEAAVEDDDASTRRVQAPLSALESQTFNKYTLEPFGPFSPPPAHDPRGMSFKHSSRGGRKASFSQYPPRFDSGPEYASLPKHHTELARKMSVATSASALTGASFMDVPAGLAFHSPSQQELEIHQPSVKDLVFKSPDVKSPLARSKPVRAVDGVINPPSSDDEGRESAAQRLSPGRTKHSPGQSTYDEDDVFGMDA